MMLYFLTVLNMNLYRNLAPHCILKHQAYTREYHICSNSANETPWTAPL